MRKVNMQEAKAVEGGRWKCKKCGKTFKIWLALWSSFGHDSCVGSKFGYKFVF